MNNNSNNNINNISIYDSNYNKKIKWGILIIILKKMSNNKIKQQNTDKKIEPKIPLFKEPNNINLY